MAYQSDLAQGFESVQRRLNGQALDLYTLSVGGGYLLIPAPDKAGQPTWEEQLLAV